MAEARYQDLPADDRRDALEVAERRSSHQAYLLEKDVWVVATLRALFDAPFAEHLTFKGGTSLSKVWGAIRRFSEDIDITYDIRAFVPDLVSGSGDEALPPTRSKEKRWTRAIRSRLAEWVRDQACPTIEEELEHAGFVAQVRAEAERLYIGYVPLFEDTGFVRPQVMVEFGARSTGEPHRVLPVVCDAEVYLPDLAFPQARPIVMLAERTFGRRRPLSTSSAARSGAGANACRGTGTISRVLTRRELRRAPLPTARSRFQLPATRRCSSPRTMPVASGSTMRLRSQATCN